MDSRIEWKCLGDEYLLMMGGARRSISSELWWKSFSGAVPTQEELQRMWTVAFARSDVDTRAREQVERLKLVNALETYIDETRVELEEARAAEAAGTGSRAEVTRLTRLLEDGREQLRAVGVELRERAD
jgi:hypothetical protein